MKIDKMEYLSKHIPYSLRIMLGHKVFIHKYYPKVISDSQILEAVFVGSLAKGRMLLETMGIRLKKDGTELYNIDFKNKNNKDDVNVEMLDGKKADVDIIKTESPTNYEYLKNYLIAANKYELHLTEQKVERDLEKYNMAIPVIFKLIDTHIYSTPNNLKIREQLIKDSIINFNN